MSGEINWEEETEVREVIADIRDPDCELNWYSKILTNNFVIIRLLLFSCIGP